MKKRVSDSIVEIAHIVRPTDLNSAKRLFGGTLMAWIDEAAVIVAKRHANMNVTTASVDNLNFLRTAHMRDVIVIIGRITYVGKTSMEVKVESFVEHITGERELVNKAYITMVGIDENWNGMNVDSVLKDRLAAKEKEIQTLMKKVEKKFAEINDKYKETNQKYYEILNKCKNELKLIGDTSSKVHEEFYDGWLIK